MASIVLGVVGAVIGAPFGAASLGWAIGSSLGSMLSQEDGPNITREGPRLGDLRVQSSTYGVSIPRAFGSVRLAGNMVWSLPIDETRHESTSGGDGKGGGGPSMTTVSYTYSQSFAVGVCQGEILGIVRIWANGNLIFNVAPDASPSTLIASIKSASNVTIYNGSETQTANSLIQAAQGATDTPAFRGLAYVVFENLQLADYGNRTPNIEFEVIATGSDGELISLISSPGLTTGTILTYENGRIYAGNTTGSSFTYSEAEYSVDGDLLRPAITYTAAYSAYSHVAPVRNWRGLYFGITSPGRWLNIIAGADVPLTTYPDWMYYGSGWYASGIKFSSTTVLMGPYGSTSIYMSIFLNETDTPSADPVLTKIAITVAAGSPDLGTYGDVTLGRMYYLTKLAAGVGDSWWLYEYDAATGALLDYWDCGSSIPASGFTKHGYKVEENYLYFAGKASEYRVLQLNDDHTVTALTSPTGNLANGPCALGYLPRIFWTSARIYRLNAQIGNASEAGSGVAVSDVLTSLCSSVGVTSIDVTDLTDDYVRGYLVPSRGPIRGAIEPLMRTYYFDVVEADGTIVFVQRGGSPIRTLSVDDLAAHEYGSDRPDAVLLERSQEVELPEEVAVVYMDKDAAYQYGAQYSRRLIGASRLRRTIQLPLVITASKAKQVADVLTFSAWQGRTSFIFSTGLKHTDLTPTDVIYVPKGDTLLAIRLTSRDEANGVLHWTAEAEDPQAYSQSGAAASLPVPPDTVAMADATKLFILDIPLLRDQDDGYGFYMAGSGFVPGWKGCQPYKSNDEGASWSVFGQGILSEATNGTATTALGNYTQNMFDEGNSVTVVLMRGSLSSISELSVLNGGNAALLGDEIIQFRTATLTATNTYVLTGLLRGRKGTEWARSTHAAGEEFVLLTSDTVFLQPGNNTEIASERLYRGVTFGGYLDDMPTQAFTFANVAAKPYSPVLLGGGRNAGGDITINWCRRGRVANGWADNADIPLGEDSESYEVDIFSNSSYTTLKRTLTSATQTVTYTSAQQVTDFGGNQSTIYARVYQLSALVGRGTKLEGTV